MASYTTNLNLLKKDPVEDGADTFNIDTMLNDNWDKIDRAVGSDATVRDELNAHMEDKNNPHGVTASQIGAAEESHKHSASDITSGIFGTIRGGTGVTSVGGTDYTTVRFRGSALRPSDTNPTTNGTIIWTYG